MTDFNQAIKWLREGKKVRRKHWDKEYFLKVKNFSDSVVVDTYRNTFPFKLSSFLGTDWEIFEEAKRCPDVFIERAALCTIDGIRALCGTDKEYSEYVKKVRESLDKKKTGNKK